MYSICVVEDEDFVREYICAYLNKRFSDVATVCYAEDGEQALQVFDEKNIDILITDIKMPGMSGIELAEEVYKNHKNTVVVIMSAYEVFDYARRAISCNVREYLVKPVKLYEVEKLVAKIIDEFKNNEKSNCFFYDERFFEKRERFFVNLIYGSGVDYKKEIEDKKEIFFDFDIETTPCDLISLKIENYEKIIEDIWEYPKDSLKMVMNNLISGYLNSSKTFYVNDVDGVFDYIVYYSEKTAPDYDALQEKINCISKFSIKIVCKKKMIKNIYELIDFCNINADIYEKALLLVTHIKEKNYNSSSRILINLLKRKDKNDVIRCIFSILNTKVSVEDYKADYRTIHQKIVEIVESNADTGAETVKRAKEYIKSNYGKNISREDVAKAICFSPSYLSKKFKEHTGESVSDYILKVRMRKAIELMRENKYKAYEIAQKVGYGNTKYFFTVFKMFTGYTPKEYMVKIAKEQNESAVDV